MSKETTYAGKLGDWRRLLSALEANGAELGHLEVPRTRLEALLSQAVDVSREAAARTAAKQETSQQLKVLVTEGDRVATVLRVSIKQHFGIRAEKLAEFGLQPFRGRSRKAVKPAAEGPGAPAPSPTPPPLGPAAPSDPPR